jgi:rare lipoprotein A
MLGLVGVRGRILCIAALFALAGCAQAELVSHTAKKLQAPPSDAGTAEYKVGSPYEIGGVWYYPNVDYDYRQSGIASWYGPGFHGRPTANGEIFDQHRLTAAHRTLPLPSMVRVTNLENGRSVVVRVNDRGPFKNGRIIDLSERAAELLGFRGSGTAKVLVEIMEAESRRLAAIAQTRIAAASAPPPVPVIEVEAQPLAGSVNGTAVGSAEPTAVPAAAEPVRMPLTEPKPDGKVTRRGVRDTSIYVQAGAFSRRDNAVRLGAQLSVYGPTAVTQATVGDRLFFRVRLGPVESVEAADQLLATLLRDGHTGARVVVD